MAASDADTTGSDAAGMASWGDSWGGSTTPWACCAGTDATGMRLERCISSQYCQPNQDTPANTKPASSP